MSDSSSDKYTKDGVEICTGPQEIALGDGLTGSYDGVGKLTIEIEDESVVGAMIADGTISAIKLVGSEARTATAAGLTTGAITPPVTYVTIITVTSGAATNQIALPAISADTIGQVIYLSVGTNGYELITPASSGNTINLVDGDGTNQLDVAANTTVRCTQVSATSWLAETIAATTIAVTAPDND